MAGKRKILLGTGLIAAGLCILVLWNASKVTLPVLSFPRLRQVVDDELEPGKAFVVRDEKGDPVTMISRRIRVGDEVITAEGKHYRVEKVDGNRATARFLGMDKQLLAYNELFSKMEVPVAAAVRNNRPVAIYHTHSDESYLPSDGSPSIPFNGGIFQVGDSYSNKLSYEGARVLHDKTPHDPHDDNAYYRSRRTAVQLLKKNPVAIFDVHRDGVDDPEFYRRIISNEDVAQMRFVVGRENPHMAANLDFAKRLMAYANRMHWPIAKDIFVGQGNYNQDLMPTALLIEAGTYTNRKDEAMRGISLLADAVPVILGITGPTSTPGAPEYEKPVTDPTARRTGVWSSLVWIMVITLIGGGLFVLISTGSYEKAKNQLSHFFGRELADIWETKPKKRELDRQEENRGKRS
ncbi:stage II sporulation protein P [Desulfofundulus thermosubterraneus]|uniref:Stage II sporulation protein P n=1 Tax=Desulfofundulus thermosubterraneus DSM 16057 TaxID=1121432 RepID=A0A1M6JS36_9FIRM|nr:stage II sporulation protein P [Desulfofundulus thermosubterraneus]SHJ49410.1 stage II sporulation protein P [Desulfofundulus thermosubterraneus DSM 16057]